MLSWCFQYYKITCSSPPRNPRSDFLMSKEKKQTSGFPLRKTNGLCYSSMALFGQLKTGNSKLVFENKIIQAWILKRAMNGKAFTII